MPLQNHDNLSSTLLGVGYRMMVFCCSANIYLLPGKMLCAQATVPTQAMRAIPDTLGWDAAKAVRLQLFCWTSVG